MRTFGLIPTFVAMPAVPPNKKNTDRLIGYFLAGWTLLNIVQAITAEIHADEAYYWLYSRYLDWGYFDHPPMVALFIRAGDSIVHSEFGVRLVTVLSSTASLYLLWLVVKKYGAEAKWFVLVASGVFIFNLYGFMVTPDAPLFLITALFYFIYQKYAEHDQIKWALLLALIIAGLLYSKYHGILLVAFTVLSDPTLFKRRTFWLIVLASLALYLPHILWQANHGYPSVNYHLFEQTTDHYNFDQTWTYFPGQLLMAGPLIGWLWFYKVTQVKVVDKFIRCLLVNVGGIFLFFLVSSFRGEVQPQWTLIGFAPLMLLTLIAFKQGGNWQPWVTRLAIINTLFVVLIRVLIITASPLIRKVGQIKSQFGYREWTRIIRQKAGDNYVIFNEGFQNPSKYDFYTNSTKGFAYDNRNYRLTQFDIWPIEEGFQRKKAYFVLRNVVKGITTDTLNTPAGTWYAGWVNDVRTYQQVKIELAQYQFKARAGEKISIDLRLTDPYSYPIDFSNKGYQHQVVLEACTFKGVDEQNVQASGSDFHLLELNPGESKHYTFNFTAPLMKGKYNLLFSLRTDPFPGSKNSRIIKLNVE